MNKTNKTGVYNIGSGVSCSVKDVIDIVQKYTMTNKPIVCKHQLRKNEIDDVVADCSMAKNSLGWEKEIGFEQGIEKIVEHELTS